MTTHGFLSFFSFFFFFLSFFLSFSLSFQDHSIRSTCALVIRQLGIKKLHVKSFQVISDVPHTRCRLNILAVVLSLFTVSLNCRCSFNGPKTQPQNSFSATTCRGCGGGGDWPQHSSPQTGRELGPCRGPTAPTGLFDHLL